MASFYTLVRRVTDAAAAIAALCVLLSLSLVCYSVGMRYLANRPEPWVDEMVGYVLVASVMLAIAEALRKGEHIAVDILTERLGARPRRIVLVIGLLAVIVTAAVLVDEGWEMVAFSKMVGIRSIGYLAAEMWMVQLLIPIGGALLLLAAIAELTRAWRGPASDEIEMTDRAKGSSATGVD